MIVLLCSWHNSLWILGMGHWAWGIGYGALVILLVPLSPHLPNALVHSIANLTDLWGHSSH
ncbi:hypothetical protein F8S20_16260 [Nostoc sp. BAE]|nr:hypothetical protein [Nostoc commune BAE]